MHCVMDYVMLGEAKDQVLICLLRLTVGSLTSTWVTQRERGNTASPGQEHSLTEKVQVWRHLQLIKSHSKVSYRKVIQIVTRSFVQLIDTINIPVSFLSLQHKPSTLLSHVCLFYLSITKSFKILSCDLLII